MSGLLIGTPVIKNGDFKKVRRLGESEEYVIKDEVNKLRNANNNPKKQKPERHQVFVPNKLCNRTDYIKRQNTLAPDKDVQKTSKTFLTNGGKFRKHVFSDGTEIVAPKGHLMSGAAHNGTRKQGLNTVFVPNPESKENAGFILNTNHNNI